MLRFARDSSRIDTAMTENEDRAPTIQPDDADKLVCCHG